MQVQPILDLPSTHEKVEQAAVNLGDRIRQHPLYQEYMQAIMDLEKDSRVPELSFQIQAKRNAVYNGKDNPDLNAELQRLELELEALPSIQAYRSPKAKCVPSCMPSMCPHGHNVMLFCYLYDAPPPVWLSGFYFQGRKESQNNDENRECGSALDHASDRLRQPPCLL